VTKFEERGVEMQYNSVSRADADRKFKRSCDSCCRLGLRISCDSCAINSTHDNAVEYFEKYSVQAQYRAEVLA